MYSKIKLSIFNPDRDSKMSLIERILPVPPAFSHCMGPSLYYVSKGTGWLRSEKWHFLLTFSTIMLTKGKWVDKKKVREYADAMQGWSLINKRVKIIFIHRTFRFFDWYLLLLLALYHDNKFAVVEQTQ